MTARAPPLDDAPRPPPHDLDTERHLLAAEIEGPENLALVFGKLLPAPSYAESNRRTFEAVIDLSTNFKAIDYVTLGGWLRDNERLAQVGGAQYLNDLAFAPCVGNVEQMAAR